MFLLAACIPAPDPASPAPGTSAGGGSTGDAVGWFDRAVGWESAERGVGTGLVSVDVDGDGDADLVSAWGNDIERGPVLVHRNEGGTLEASASWRSETLAHHGHLAAGDLDGDGRVDLAVARFLGDGGFEEPGGVDIYLQGPDGLPAEPDLRLAPGTFTFSVALGDVDLDGDLDLYAVSGEPYLHDPSPGTLYRNDGAGGFEEVWRSDGAGHELDAAFVDLDGDGWLDLALARAGAPHAVWRNAGGWFPPEPAALASGSSFGGLALDWGDLDGDGLPDLVVAENDRLGGEGRLEAFCGPGLDPCWTSEPVPMASAVSLEDADGDGWLDLVAGAWWGPLRAWRGGPGGLSPAADWIGSDEAVWEALAWADLDASERETLTLEGERLLPVPRGEVLDVDGGVAGDGYVTGPGWVSATVRLPSRRDLAASLWDAGRGDVLLPAEEGR